MPQFPIYIISLPYATHRREHIAKQFSKTGLHFEFIDGVEGINLDLKQEEKKQQSFVKRRHREITKSELGCALSHQKAYKKLLTDKHKWAIVLEDDTFLTENFFKLCVDDTVFTDVDKNDLLLLCLPDLIVENYITLAKKNYMFNSIEMRKIFSSIRRASCCAAAYVINDQFAQKMINLHREKGFFLADEWDFFKREKVINNIYFAPICHHDSEAFTSHIEKERGNIKKTENFFIKIKRKSRISQVKWFFRRNYKRLASYFLG